MASTKLSMSCFVSGAVPVTTDSDSHPWSQAIWEVCEAAVAVAQGDGMCAWPGRRVGDSRIVESSASLSGLMVRLSVSRDCWFPRGR